MTYHPLCINVVSNPTMFTKKIYLVTNLRLDEIRYELLHCVPQVNCMMVVVVTRMVVKSNVGESDEEVKMVDDGTAVDDYKIKI